ncbi:NADPH-dependent FMN reductase [Ideonella sp.]|uniref:NADPH-dependent FMN reductase n=1 Tax=Ideonella sp. TaxID=1929293 RepID=UPI0035B3096A
MKLLLISGSQRQGSFNLSLAHVVAGLARARGAEVNLLDLRALALPLYDGDLEAASGVPAGARTLQAALAEADAMLVVTPEYNGFPTPLVINAFDWLSRLGAGDGLPTGLATTANKPVGLLSASPGALGGLRSMNYLRQYFQMNFQMVVQPQQNALSRAGDAFDESGALKDPKTAAAVAGVVDALLAFAAKLAAR